MKKKVYTNNGVIIKKFKLFSKDIFPVPKNKIYKKIIYLFLKIKKMYLTRNKKTNHIDHRLLLGIKLIIHFFTKYINKKRHKQLFCNTKKYGLVSSSLKVHICAWKRYLKYIY